MSISGAVARSEANPQSMQAVRVRSNIHYTFGENLVLKEETESFKGFLPLLESVYEEMSVAVHLVLCWSWCLIASFPGLCILFYSNCLYKTFTQLYIWTI